MEPIRCDICQNSKAPLVCGFCKCHLCKTCVQFTSEDSFSFLEEIPEELAVGAYCGPCYDQKVEPELQAYERALTRARQMSFFYKKQSKESRRFKRMAPAIVVEGCADKDEAILRLAFLAAKANFNLLVDVDLRSEKVKLSGYQTSRWSAKGIPVNSSFAK